MIIDIGTGIDESVVKWKYNDKDKWRDADIDELIHLYESVVRCKDCRHRDLFSCPLADNDFQKDEDFCSWGEEK